MASRIANIKEGLNDALKSDKEKLREEEMRKKKQKKEILIEAINFFK